ncbi:MAG: protein kinase [Acidobacteria bacterium]|nr:protein kinase [Acidobacteriota bacterium]
MPTCSNPRCALPKPSETGRCLTCHSLFVGTLVRHRYEIQKIVGKGGFGTTYLIDDQDCFNEPRILKELSPRQSSNNEDEDDLGITAERLFRREAQVLLNLQHPGIPKLYAYFTDQDYSYLVQDFIPGSTLAEEIDKHKHIFSEKDVRFVLLELADILDYLHTRTPPIVHRDVKPQNLMRHSNGHLQLIDFGAVCLAVASGGANSSQTLIGSPGYAPPEQIFGHPVPQSDLYAAGATVLRLLTGTHPSQFFNNRTQQMEWQSKVNVSPEFGEILNDLLARDAKKRLPSAAELKIRLEKLTSKPLPNTLLPLPDSQLNTTGETLCFPNEELAEDSLSNGLPIEVKLSTDSQELSLIEVEDFEVKPLEQILNTPPDQTGDLTQNSIIFLLRNFFQEKASGYLVCTTGNITKTVYIDKGLVIFASSNITSERLGEFLLSIGRITQENFSQASEIMKQKKIRLGSALVEIGVLEQPDLYSLVIEQVSSIVYSLFNWTQGEYKFWQRTPPEEEIKISLSCSEIILQGLQRLEDTSLLKSWVGDFSRKLSLTNDTDKLYKSIKLDPKQAFVVSRIDRPMSVEEILTMGGLPETEILKTVYGLLSVGVLEWVVEVTKEKPSGFFTGGSGTASSQSLNQAEMDVQSAAEFCYEVENTLRYIQNASHYSVLELDRDASQEAIQTAYARLVQKFHPDRHNQLAKYNLSIKNELDKVFDRITQAFHVLTNRKLKEEYDASFRTTKPSKPSSPDNSYTPKTNSALFPKVDQNPPTPPRTNLPPLTKPSATIANSNLTNNPSLTKTNVANTNSSYPSTSLSQSSTQNPDTKTSNQQIPAYKANPIEDNTKPTNQRLGTPVLPNSPINKDTPYNRSTATASAKTWFQKGLEYYKVNLFGQACRAFQAAVSADPQEAEYHIYLARSLALMKDFYTEAEQEFYKAIELSPKNADYFAELGLFYQKINLTRQAMEMFDKAIELLPTHETAQRAKKEMKKS